jgi:DNA-binding GntR family transcriptional regulator
LADAGLVKVTAQVGTRVARIRMVDVEEARFVREALEVAAFEAACLSGDNDVSPLRALLAKQESAHETGDFETFFAADEALHLLIFTMGGHPGAWHAVQRMKVQLGPAATVVPS